MPDHRCHRGPHPEDAELFASAAWPALRAATADLAWLLSRDYAAPSALKLVGDRHGLRQRQRIAVMRCACSDQVRAQRLSRLVDPAAALGRDLRIDGYNVLTTIEVALGGGVLLQARDLCLRDMASMHGTYRSVEETAPALQLIGQTLAAVGIASAHWYLDSPVSNSGRLRQTIEAAAAASRWPWTVQLVQNPDTVLIRSPGLIATADSAVLDRCGDWLNLAALVVRQHRPEARIVDLSGQAG